MENHNEKGILYSYIKDNNVIYSYSDEKIQKKLNSIINNVVQYNRPDMYSIIKDEVIMIEHFEFDSYSSNKKGSDYRRKEGNIKNEFDKLLKNRNEDQTIYNKTIKSTSSKDNYINNFLNVFEEHYKKIDMYSKRIRLLSNYKIDTYFFIEDVSPLGSYYINSKREPKYLLIFQFKKIINFLLSHNEVSAIIYGFSDGNKKRLVLLENNEDSIKKLLQDYELADELKCYWFEPNVSAFSFPIMKIEEE